MAGGNDLRMPFAEWLATMAQCHVPPPARVIAVYSAAFDITSNAELGRLTGVEGRSLDKWKGFLLANGWVVIPPCRGGRGNGIEVLPAYRETPIRFTDLRAKKGGKYYPRNNRQTPAEIAEVSTSETPAKFAPLSETPAEFAEVLPETHAEIAGVSRARVLDNNINYNNIYNNNNNITTYDGSYITPARAKDAAVVAAVSGEILPPESGEKSKTLRAVFTELSAAEMSKISDRLVGACNGALADPAAYPALAAIAIPLAWIEGGCDLEADILPTLKAMGVRNHGKGIKSWNYFTDAVFATRDRRIGARRAMPATGRPAMSEQEKILQMVVKAQNQGQGAQR